jgi:hypothetical protein
MAGEFDGTSLGEMKRIGNPISFVFGTGGRIRQSPRKIDVSVLDHARGF